MFLVLNVIAVIAGCNLNIGHHGLQYNQENKIPVFPECYRCLFFSIEFNISLLIFHTQNALIEMKVFVSRDFSLFV